MSFRALLVTKADQVTEALVPVLSNFALAATSCGYSDALCLVTEQKFQLVLVDFDDPHSAALVLQNLSSAPFQAHAITVALLSDKNRVRNAFGAGANFILYKPIRAEEAADTLRAATALIKRERRNSFRVPIQVPVMLSLPNDAETPEIEGILLDLSETGMDVLASQPLHPAARLRARFTLPNSASEFEILGDVAWANPNGETGVHFAETPEALRTALRSWLAENSKSIPEEPDPVPNCKLTDLSLGACYVETTSPFPEHTFIQLILRADGVELRAPGTVRVMHPVRGMGVEFAVQTESQRRQTEEFIHFLTSRPGVRPELLVSPEKIASPQDSSSSLRPQDVEDPLLDLLRNHHSFTEEAFLQVLSSQRGGDFVSSE